MSFDNSRNMKEAMSAAKPRKLRAYEWCRLRNDFADLPLWRAVAKRAGVHLTHVMSMVVRLDALANRSNPRGSVADMSIPEFAASLDLSLAAVARIRSVLEEPDIAWIDQDYVVDFHQRNPDHEDTTAAERQRRRRLKLKTEREQAMTRPPPSTYPQSRVTSRDVTRDTVTVTPRSEQILKEAASMISEIVTPVSVPSPAVSAPVPVAEIVDAEAAQKWLSREGKALVSERMKIPESLAETTIARWGRDLADDVALVQFILEASASAHPDRTSHFMVMVTDQVKRRRQEKQGRQLPFPPMPVKRSNENG